MTTLPFHHLAVGARFRLMAFRGAVSYAVGPVWEKIDLSHARRPCVILSDGDIRCKIAARRVVTPAEDPSR